MYSAAQLPSKGLTCSHIVHFAACALHNSLCTVIVVYSILLLVVGSTTKFLSL